MAHPYVLQVLWPAGPSGTLYEGQQQAAWLQTDMQPGRPETQIPVYTETMKPLVTLWRSADFCGEQRIGQTGVTDGRTSVMLTSCCTLYTCSELNFSHKSNSSGRAGNGASPSSSSNSRRVLERPSVTSPKTAPWNRRHLDPSIASSTEITAAELGISILEFMPYQKEL